VASLESKEVEVKFIKPTILRELGDLRFIKAGVEKTLKSL
jgi:hypothetical protein